MYFEMIISFLGFGQKCLMENVFLVAPSYLVFKNKMKF
ncbi:hypothetical protein LEP1GSC145_0330 [Leptospira interrogans serovar Djasiman str. LT1649]|nr:hypothetical protein LEP1GSC148_1795 [Leptospira interrogans serovar Canicola str. LT1962]EMJ47467.1 hypothetical protein LEP1GSC111_3229 [Leptospira interrogans str. UT126]EMM89707.1 hypothetical protein LEP1GSC145_0330 [Leptospira interrogans serovar Djasiman str. LT1649]